MKTVFQLFLTSILLLCNIINIFTPHNLLLGEVIGAQLARSERHNQITEQIFGSACVHLLRYENIVPFLWGRVKMISSSSALTQSAESAAVSPCTTCGDSLNSSSSSRPAATRAQAIVLCFIRLFILYRGAVGQSLTLNTALGSPIFALLNDKYLNYFYFHSDRQNAALSCTTQRHDNCHTSYV